MRFGRRKQEDREGEEATEEAAGAAAASVEAAEPGTAAGADASDGSGDGPEVADRASSSPRANGPWDASEVEVPNDDGSYVDLGALVVKGRPGFELRIPTHPETGEPRAVVLVTEDSMVEVLVFAASRTGGLWDDVRAEIVEEAARLQGTVEEIEGSFGTELQVQVPVETPDGKPGTQPSRIVGVDGPRWLLRATFMGQEALEPAPDGLLESALRDLVVVRGKEPMAPREQIPVVMPEGAVRVDGDDTADSSQHSGNDRET